MINEELIKEFASSFGCTPSHDSEKEAFFLAKLYLETLAKMPDEKDYDFGFFGHEEKRIRNIIGDVISECTLSAMKMLEEKDKRIAELESELSKQSHSAQFRRVEALQAKISELEKQLYGGLFL